MNRTTLLAGALLSALAIVAVAVAAPQEESPHGARHMQLDTNLDGAIDRAEAAAHPRLAEKFEELDRNGDGRLDASERPQRKGMRGQGKRGIAAADTDGDGRLSRAEAAAHPRMAEHFDAMDANSDGFVARDEMRAHFERVRPQMQAEREKRSQERFAAADLNGDDKLSRAEIEQKMPRLSARFDQRDTDKDGFLSREDLQRKHR